MSPTETAIASLAVATERTPLVASPDAAAARLLIVSDCCAVLLKDPAEASSSVDADDTISMISPTAPSN
jgi:hypothetical protein